MKNPAPIMLRALSGAALLIVGCVSPYGGVSAPTCPAAETTHSTATHSIGDADTGEAHQHNEPFPLSPAGDAQQGESLAPEGYPEPFGADLTQGWMDPWLHSHFSRRGTPFVHLFGLEPAFLDRGLFLDYRKTRGDGENESELEAELEWAITRRLGVVIEAPYVRVDPDGESAESGLGDVAIAPRALLVDSETALLSGSLEFSLPSGSEHRGLGSGEAGLAPSLTAWLDLGNWIQASVQIGTEHGLETGDAELFYNAALAYSFLAPSFFSSASHSHGHGSSHYPAGLNSVIVEFTGRTILDGADLGRDTAEVLFGLSHKITESWEARGGYQVPIGGAQDIDESFVLGLTRHF